MRSIIHTLSLFIPSSQRRKAFRLRHYARRAHPILIEAMSKLHDALAKTPMHNKYWVCGGALLGWAREGALLKHDPDIDFHFWQSDLVLFMQSVPALQAAGFEPSITWTSNNGQNTEYTFTYRGVSFEFFVATRVGNNTQSHFYGLYGKQRRLYQMVFETPGYELNEFEFYGRTWLKPVDHEAYLTAQYGDWKTPDKNFDHTTSDALISKTLILKPGKKRWAGGSEKLIRGYTSGVFDLFHTGHVRAIELAKAECDYLIVGVSSDESCAEYKRTPMLPYTQRREMIAACKYVDEVIEAPNYPTEQFYKQHGIDICIQGEDTPGLNFYEVAKSLGIIKFVGYQAVTSSSAIIKHVQQAK